MAIRPRALLSLAMALSSVGLNSLHASKTKKEAKKARFQQYSDILKHQKEKPPLDTQSGGEAASPLRDKKDLASLFCPKLLQKTDSKTEPYPFAAANTGTANALDYLRSLATSSNLDKASSELFKQVEIPARKELEQYQNLAQRIKANAEAHKSYTVRLRKHFSTQYKNDKDAKAEATALKELNTKISSQAANDFEAMKALGFNMKASYSTREADPIVNSNIVQFEHGFVYRMNERRSFLNSLPRETPLLITSISGTADYVQGGASKKLTEIFLVDGELGHKIAVDELGKFYIASNGSPTPFEPLCDSSIAAPQPKEATNISELINRFLETGHIKLSEKECADLQKQLGEYDSTGTYIARAMTNAIDYRGKEGVEILIPKKNFSEELNKSISQATSTFEQTKETLNVHSAELEKVQTRIREHYTSSEGKKTSAQTDAEKASNEIQIRQFKEDISSHYEGEGIGPSLEALEKNYPSLIIDRPDLAKRFLDHHHVTRSMSEKLNIDNIKAEGLKNDEYFPLALVSDVETANTDAFDTALFGAEGTSQEKPLKRNGFTYEQSVNPETGNLEIYLCETPMGEPQLPLKRLDSKPLFTIDKGNLKNIGSPKKLNDSAYNPSLWGILATKLGCPGEPPVDFDK